MTVFLGNDVVDLTSPFARGKSENNRFVSKILISEEQNELSLSSDSDTLLWYYWAAKEAAYKALSRYEPNISSVPRRYHVVWENADALNGRGLVHTPTGTLPISVCSNSKRVLCICFKSDSPMIIKFDVHELNDHTLSNDTTTTPAQSQLVREKAIHSLSMHLCCPEQSLTIQRPIDKNGHTGPPTVLFNETPIPVILSLSHDGKHVFYIWCMDTRNLQHHFPNAVYDDQSMIDHDILSILMTLNH